MNKTLFDLVLKISLIVFISIKNIFAFDLSATQQRKIPIEIEADQGIVCEQNKNKCVARENVVVHYGTTTLSTHQLTAYLTKGEQGQQQRITRLEAEQGVKIVSSVQGQQHKGYAERALYDIDRGHVTLTGQNLRMELGNDTIITAKDSMQFSKKDYQAMAQGLAVIIHNNRRIEADEIHAFFLKDNDGRLVIDRVKAIGHVAITAKDQTAWGNEGEYNVKTGKARLQGDVYTSYHQAKGTIRSKSENMIVDLNTGEYSLLSIPSADDTKHGKKRSKRVRISIIPAPQVARE